MDTELCTVSTRVHTGTIVNGALDVQSTLTGGSAELSTELRILRARPADDYLTITGGAQGTYLNSVLWTASAIRADNGIVSAPAYLQLIGGSTGVQAQGDLARGQRAAARGLRLREGLLTASSAGGVELFAPNQAIFLRTSSANDGEVIVNFGFQNLSDPKLKKDVEPAGLEELQEVFDAVTRQWYRRTEGNQKRTLGFIVQDVQDGRGGQGAVRAGRGRGAGRPGDARLLQAGLRALGRVQKAAGAGRGTGEEGRKARPLVKEEWQRMGRSRSSAIWQTASTCGTPGSSTR